MTFMAHFGAALAAVQAAQESLLALRLTGHGPELDAVAVDLAAAEDHMKDALAATAVALTEGTSE